MLSSCKDISERLRQIASLPIVAISTTYDRRLAMCLIRRLAPPVVWPKRLPDAVLRCERTRRRSRVSGGQRDATDAEFLPVLGTARCCPNCGSPCRTPPEPAPLCAGSRSTEERRRRWRRAEYLPCAPPLATERAAAHELVGALVGRRVGYSEHAGYVANGDVADPRALARHLRRPAIPGKRVR